MSTAHIVALILGVVGVATGAFGYAAVNPPQRRATLSVSLVLVAVGVLLWIITP